MKKKGIYTTVKAVLFLAVLSVIVIGCSAEGKNAPGTKEGKTAEETKLIHPAFSCTADDLVSILQGLPEDIRFRVLQRQQYFLELVKQVLERESDLVRLVDKEHPLPSDYAPEDLVRLTDYPVYLNRNDLRLRKVVLPDLLAMNQAAENAGIRLVLSSTYRSYAYQKKVFQRNVNELGEAEAKRVSAEPGKSQHQLGTTIDFGSITPEFARTAAGKWLKAHAWEYGFSLSYPENMETLTGYKHEIWHYRYIGRQAAELEHQFFEGIQQYMLLFFHDHTSDLLKWMEKGN